MNEPQLDAQLYRDARSAIVAALDYSQHWEIRSGLEQGLDELARLGGLPVPEQRGASGDDSSFMARNAVMCAGGHISTHIARPDFKLWRSVTTGLDQFENRYIDPIEPGTLRVLQRLQLELAVGLSLTTRPSNRTDRREFLNCFRRAAEIAVTLPKWEAATPALDGTLPAVEQG